MDSDEEEMVSAENSKEDEEEEEDVENLEVEGLEDVEEDDGYVMSGEPGDLADVVRGSGGGATRGGQAEEEFRYEVLTADQIVQHMVDCIKDVNTVVQVRSRTLHLVLYCTFSADVR